MTTARRRAAIAATTAALLVIGVFVGAAPADAATNSTTFHFSGARGVDDVKGATAIRGSGAAITLSSGWKTHYYGRDIKPKFVVQRKIGSSHWKTVKHVKTGFVRGRGAIAKIPAYGVPAGVAVQVVKYRLKSIKKGAVKNRSYSGTITVKYLNPAAYTGLQQQVYAAIAPYCPTAAVRLDANLGPQGYAGEFSPSRSITIDPGIAAYDPVKIAGVALHECAHFKQYYNYGGTYKGEQKAIKAARAVFVNDVNPDPSQIEPTGLPSEPAVGGFDPIEHGADCSSHALNPQGYLGYGGYCNPAELAEGLKLMQGQKY